MRHRINIVAATAAIACSVAQPGTAAAAERAVDKATQRKIDAIVTDNRKVYGGATPVPGVLVGIWDAKGRSYVKGYGVADLATHRPLQAADTVRIGSITKSFLTEVLFQLADEGKLSLDDPIGKFDIGLKVPNADTLTLRQLAQMRSGLPEFFDMPEAELANLKLNSAAELRTMLAAAFEKKPATAPGQRYDYCNTNYLLLGLVIEQVTHHDVGTEIQTRILDPNKLAKTHYPVTQAMPKPWAHGYVRTAKAGWTDAGDSIPVMLSGAAGAMTSDLHDMARWARLLAVGKNNDAATQERKLDCRPTGIGNISFGVGVVCSAGWFGYTGGLPGYNTAAYYAPATKTTIVVFVMAQIDDPLPGVANKTFSDIAALFTSGDRPLKMAGL